jgi:hypothetical protein
MDNFYPAKNRTFLLYVDTVVPMEPAAARFALCGGLRSANPCLAASLMKLNRD